jgi:hypothetical protein
MRPRTLAIACGQQPARLAVWEKRVLMSRSNFLRFGSGQLTIIVRVSIW